MKLCPNAGATLEETRSSSEQVTVETVSYSVCEGPGSLLKSRGCPMDRWLFRDRQLDPGDSALSLWSWPLQTQTCFYSEHIIHWFILWGFSLEVHMFVAGLLLWCEGPGSLLKFRGSSLDQSLFRDSQLKTGDSALSSSSSSKPLIFSLRGKTLWAHRNQDKPVCSGNTPTRTHARCVW